MADTTTIDDLSPGAFASVDHIIPAWKGGRTVNLTVQQILSLLTSGVVTSTSGGWDVGANLNVTGRADVNGILWNLSNLVNAGGDWDNIIEGGVYRGRQIDNAPTASSEWFHVLVLQHDVDYGVQVALGLNLSAPLGMWWRRRTPGGWSQWYWLFDETRIASETEAEEGIRNDKPMSPLRVKQAIASQVTGAVYESTEQTITSGGLLTLNHGIGATPTQCTFTLVCQTAEYGFQVGDELIVNPASNVMTSLSGGIAVLIDSTQIRIRYGSAGTVFQVVRWENGNAVQLVNDNWRLVVRARS